MSAKARSFYRKLAFLWEDETIAGDGPSNAALDFLSTLASGGNDDDLVPPFRGALERIYAEYDAAADLGRFQAFEELERLIDARGTESDLADAIWKAFFPEALYLDKDPHQQISLLRQNRRVKIVRLAERPIENPAREIVFTSNVLLSPPLGDAEEESGNIAEVIEGARKASNEPQLYWYDHPIPIGIPIASDEFVYGLCGLADALKYEKLRGSVSPEDRLTVFLSVSVTHEGLHEWAHRWLRARLAELKPGRLNGLDVYAFTESDTRRIVDILAPWLENTDVLESLQKCFGVDGEYGRHYSFLKAFPALWSVLMDKGFKATFKLDLDQVAPQNELCAETGKSFFEHFRTRLWGAHGVDGNEREVDFGLIAGAVVNEKDIVNGIFTPDIMWPDKIPRGEDLIFFKQRPMAVSTRAELMTCYGIKDAPDGVTEAIQRIHATGGTVGIRFDALRRYRPFTPTFVGRAEDQAYILSVLDSDGKKRALRYVHASGLIMRHDKEAFANEAIKAAKAGTYVGDLLRLFVFSSYASFLPGGQKRIKKIIDPFTGCFITPMPTTLALLKLALNLLTVDGGSTEFREKVLKLAGSRLSRWISNFDGEAEGLERLWHRERRAWDGFYEALNKIEKALPADQIRFERSRRAFRKLCSDCRIST